MKFLGKDMIFKPQILFHDNHICVAVKAPGQVVQMEEGVKSLEKWVKEKLKQELQKEVIFLQPIHRLDKPAQGLVIFARSSKALTRLQEAMRQDQIEKFYLAIVEGHLKKQQGQLIHQLIHADYHAQVVQSNGKKAHLYYRTFRKKGSQTILSVKLVTGRYHQIRAQFAHVGHPIVGDKRYGAKSQLEQEAIALYHTKTLFRHPVTKKRLVFTIRPHLLSC